MAKELLVNVSRGEEVRVALVEDGRLEEIYLERDSAASNVGNIYLGKVTNVEGSIQAAFVDFGYGRNGFLHVQDLHPDYFPEGGKWDRMVERVGKKIGRRDRPPIQDCLRRGDEIIVQIIKEGIGTKGPTLTSYPSIPGRFLVMMPGVRQMGVSKNIEDEDERRRLRKILDGLSPPKDVGFIIRSAGMGKTKTELERDFKYLSRLWDEIEKTKKGARPPTLLYSEGDLVTRTVRDVWTPDIDRVVVDEVETALQIKQFFKLLMPRTKVDVQLYQGTMPLFHAAGIESEIETMFSRHVPLRNGGSLVIDSTEAVVAIDVNSGKFREHSDAEETAFRMDLEAAEEICRQLRLRDLGGVVIVDFIDLRFARHRQALFDRLTDLFKRDKAKSRHLEMNEFGIICITRQRMRPDLKKAVFMPCPMSGGTGFIKTPESMTLDVMRRLRVAASDERVETINVSLYPTAALHVLNTKRQTLAELEQRTQTIITIRQDETLAADEVGLELLDERDGLVVIDALRPPSEEGVDQGGHRKRRRRRGRGSNDRDQRGEKKVSEVDTDESGLIELDDLLPLGELKLEETERLMNELQSEEGAKREVENRDPRQAVLEALKRAEVDGDEVFVEPEEAQGDRQDTREARAEGEAEEGGRRRRRRRRRGRGGDEEHHERNGQVTETRRPVDATEDQAEDDEEHEAEHEAEQETHDEQPAAEAGRSEEAHGEEGGRRRRRRRRRRRGHREEGEQEATPDERDQRQPSESADEGEPEPVPAASDEDEDDEYLPRSSNLSPDELLDASVNGNRIDMETHTLRRDPFRRHDSEEDEEGHGSRRRRRRKGRGLRNNTVFGHTGGAESESRPVAKHSPQGQKPQEPRPEGKSEPRPQPAKPQPRPEGRRDDRKPAPAPVPTPAVRPVEEGRTGEEGEGGGRRRRRRRRRRGKGSSGESPASPLEASESPQGDPILEAADEAEAATETDLDSQVREPEPTTEAEPMEEVVETPEPAEEPEPVPVKKTTRKSAKKTAKKEAKKTTKRTSKKAAAAEPEEDAEASPKKAAKRAPRKRAKKAAGVE